MILNITKESSKDLGESAMLYGSVDEVHARVKALKMEDEGVSIIAFLLFDKIA